MNNLVSIPEEIQLMIVDFLTRSISYSDSIKLKTWIESDSLNQTQFQHFKSSWLLTAADNKKATNHLSLWESIETEIKIKDDPKHKFKSKTNRISYFAIAASWLIMALLGASLSWFIPGKTENIAVKTTEYNVPIGSKSIIKLPDGSTVWLNAGSKLTFNSEFDKNERSVNLIGEGYFSVVSNRIKPFKVVTSDIEVQALGTKFNVKAYPEEKTITTTLEEGEIQVQILNKKGKTENSRVKISPKEKMVYYKNGLIEAEPIQNKVKVQNTQIIDNTISLEEDINTELYTSWKSGEWIIEGISLKCLAPMLERKYNMTIKFEDEELQRFKFTGTIQNETVEQFLKALSYTAPIKYSIERDTINLLLDNKLMKNFERVITTRNE